MKLYCALLTSLLFVFTSCIQTTENWTHFRGTDQNGHSSTESAPIKWGEKENVKWKTKIRGKGWSSPVVYGNQIWISSSTARGDSLFAICIDFESGNIIEKIDLFQPENPERIHPVNSYATPTPCIEKGRVYFHFGTYGTACIDTKSMEVIWKRTDMNCTHMQGPASSLVLYKNSLIVHLEGTDNQDIYALDKFTGAAILKVGAPDSSYQSVKPVYRKSYQTPLVVNVEGEDQLITNRSLYCISYNPNTGEENWRLYYGEDSAVAVPLFYKGLVYVNSGWIVSENQPFDTWLFAVDPKGNGNVSETHVKWKSREYIPQTSTPVIVDGLMYAITERGMLSCRNAMTGEFVWTEKLKGHFDISMIYAAGHIYFGDDRGMYYVIKPGKEYQLVASNKLDGKTRSTPAILRNAILLRTENFLYKIK